MVYVDLPKMPQFYWGWKICCIGIVKTFAKKFKLVFTPWYPREALAKVVTIGVTTFAMKFKLVFTPMESSVFF
jgi:hypothetical protein